MLINIYPNQLIFAAFKMIYGTIVGLNQWRPDLGMVLEKPKNIFALHTKIKSVPNLSKKNELRDNLKMLLWLYSYFANCLKLKKLP